MNIFPAVTRESVHFFEQSFLPFLNVQQKKISAIALLALSCLAALGYAIYYRWKMVKKIDPTLDNSKNPPLNSLVNNPSINTPVNNPSKISDIQEISQEYQKGVVDFSFEVLQKKIKESDTENQLISPLGISFLMSMIRHGLSEEDQEEMVRVIHLPKNSDELKTSASKLMQKLIDSGLDIAGLLYINSRYRLNPDYQQLMSDHYKSHAESGSSAEDVNGWVQNATHGQIQKIIEQDDLVDFVLLLANAIHFKASWAEKFKEKDTRLDDFVTPSQTIQTQMMHKTDDVEYFEDDRCQAIRLPYSDKSEFSMLLILPKKDNDFSFVDASAFDDISQKMRTREVEIALPKFKIEQELDVKQMLIEMGVSHLFEKPDFSPLVDMNHIPSKNVASEITVSKIKQKSVLVCDEQGTEASVVTFAITRQESCSMPDEIKFNRPFLAALVTKEAPVIFGVIRDPSE